MNESVRRRYEADLLKTQQEIVYLKGIEHPRHAYMIRQREIHVQQLKEKMKQ